MPSVLLCSLSNLKFLSWYKHIFSSCAFPCFTLLSFAFVRLRAKLCPATFYAKLWLLCVLVTAFLFFCEVLGFFKGILYISLVGFPGLPCLIR